MHLQRNATQRNATQRNAYHNYILNNNFKFYIAQFFRAFNFLSAVFGFAKISSFLKSNQNICSFFYLEKRTTPIPKGRRAKADSRQKSTSFCQKEDKAKARFQRKTTPFRIRNSLVKTLSLRGDSRSNPICLDCHDFLRSLAMTILSFAHAVRLTAMTIKNQFATLITRGFNPLHALAFAHNGLKPHCYKKWIASLIRQRRALAPFVRNDNFNYAFSCALKNQFEIISQSDYGFCYKNYFFNLNQVFRNSYDFGERFGRNLNYGFGKDYNRNLKKNCDYGFEKNRNSGFGKNYFGNCNFGFDFGNEIYGIGNNLKGFLFNRKILKTKI